MTLPRVIDATGRPFPLDRQLAAGGEGAVFLISNAPHHVAKVYHKPPTAQTVEKLTVMAALANPRLLDLAAWPSSLLRFDSGKQVAGFVMPRLVDCQPIQHLYNPVMRLKSFPRASWTFQIRTAANLAAAFDEVHKAGCLVGDVNQSNAQVSPQALVKLIDCDSFQVRANGKQFLCEVGTPHYTPPELQGQNLRGVPRTENHDRFGLAVLIFQLLFVGRHPYAGIFRGKGDPSFEQLIAEYRFAQGPMAHTWEMGPPPHTPTFADIPPDIGQLFRRAFERGSQSGTRPRPAEWLPALKSLEQNAVECPADPGHKYWKGAGGCVWCRLAAKGGPEYYFGVAEGTGTFTPDEARLQEAIRRLSAAQLVDFPYRREHHAPPKTTPKPLPEKIGRFIQERDKEIDRINSAELKKSIDRIQSEYTRDKNAAAARWEDLERDASEKEQKLRSELGLKIDAIVAAYKEKNRVRHQNFLASEQQAVQLELDAHNKLLQQTEDRLTRELENLRDEQENESTSKQREAELAEQYLAQSTVCDDRRQSYRLTLAGIGGAVVAAGTWTLMEALDDGLDVVAIVCAGVSIVGFAIYSLFSPYGSAKLRLKLLHLRREQAAGRAVRAYRRAEQCNHRIATIHDLLRREKENHPLRTSARAETAKQRAEAERTDLKAEGESLIQQERRQTEKAIRQAQKQKVLARGRLEAGLQKLEVQRTEAERAARLSSANGVGDEKRRVRNEYTVLLATEIRARQSAVTEATHILQQLEDQWSRRVEEYRERHRRCVSAAQAKMNECRSLDTHYRKELDAVTQIAKEQARRRHLQLHLISDANILGIGAGRKQTLAASGILTAADINEKVILEIHGFGSLLTGSLLIWRREVENSFRFNPLTAVPSGDLRQLTMKYRTLQQQFHIQLEEQLHQVGSLASACQQDLTNLSRGIKTALANFNQAEADLEMANRI